MISEPEVQIRKVILSTKGPIEVPPGENVTVFGHEHLHSLVCKTPSRPLTLEHLSWHRGNLLSLENASLTPSLIEHEIHSKLSQAGKMPQVLIVDSSPEQNSEKTADAFKKYTIVRGFNYELPSSVSSLSGQLSKETEVLISTQHIGKQLQYVFGVPSEEQRGFIGEIQLPLHCSHFDRPVYRQAIVNILLCYQQYSQETECPVFINLLPRGHDAFRTQADGLNADFDGLVNTFLKQLYKNSVCYKNTILINPTFQISKKIEGSTISYINQNQTTIHQLYKLGFNICFDLSRYQNEQSLTWVSLFASQYPSQTVLSAGLKYKTDLVQFGGQGMLMTNTFSYLQSLLGEQNLWQIWQENILRLLTWYIKRIVKVQVKMWKCVKCSKESPETEQSFRKFNKDFCSIDCLRAYKF